MLPGGKVLSKMALLAGTSGLAGKALLDALLQAPEYSRVHALTRRPLGREHARLANRIVQFDRLEEQLAGLRCQHAFCCLGTTLRSAGSADAFRAAEHNMVLDFARLARSCGAERFIVVSSAGADPASKNLYLRVKGEIETALAGAGFVSLDILQPGLLLGSRAEWRPAEALMRLVAPALNPLLVGKWAEYRSIRVEDLATAMLAVARTARRGVNRYSGEALGSMARRAR